MRRPCRDNTYFLRRLQPSVSMEEKAGPPQPILIQAGTDTEPETVKAEPQHAVSMAVGVNETGGGLQEAVDHYRLTLSTKPNIVGMSVLGFLLAFVVPFFIVMGMLDSWSTSTGDDGAFGFCCFSILTGIGLVLVASTKDNAWRKEVKLAKERVINEAGLKAPAASTTPLVVAGVLFLGGFLAQSLPSSDSDVISALLFILALIASMFVLAMGAEANKIPEKYFEAVLNQVREEE